MRYILMNEEELRELLREELRGVVATTATVEKKERFDMDDAVKYLRGRGLFITKSTLYRHTSNGDIAFLRSGKRKVVFTQEQLDDFADRMIR